MLLIVLTQMNEWAKLQKMSGLYPNLDADLAEPQVQRPPGIYQILLGKIFLFRATHKQPSWLQLTSRSTLFVSHSRWILWLDWGSRDYHRLIKLIKTPNQSQNSIFNFFSNWSQKKHLSDQINFLNECIRYELSK